MGFQGLDTLGFLKGDCGVSPHVFQEASRLLPSPP
jgi:hypothetical protein